MGKLKIETAKGFSREEAFAKTELAKNGVTLKFDATTAFKNDGKPEGRHLEAFVDEYQQKRVKGVANVGFSITLEAGVADSRERPYKVENVVTKGARRWKTVYQGFVGANDKGVGGTLVFSKDTKGDAEEAGKAYVTENKVKVAVRMGKEVIGSIIKVDKDDKGKPGAAQDVAMIINYTPSINATEGNYIFFAKLED